MTDQQQLLDLAIEINSLLFGNFQLSSGGTSSYYFDGRVLTLNPKGSYLTAKCFLPIILKSGASYIAGPTLGADPIVSSVATFSYLQNSPINALIVRKEQKEHGGEKMIEGEKMSAIKEVKVLVASLSLDIAEKVIQKNLKNESSQQKLVSDLIDKIKIEKN